MQTLVAVFDNRGDAREALDALFAAGFARNHARLSEGDPAGEASTLAPRRRDDGGSTPAGETGLVNSIRHFFDDIFGTERSEDATMYTDAVTRGHYVLTLDADSLTEVERAAAIVEGYGPIDIDEHAQHWQGSPGMRQQPQAASQQFAPPPQQPEKSGALPRKDALQRGDTTAIPVVQEELKVGKRAVERGGVRIVQRVIETPVSDSIGLREEHVQVERHAVDRPLDPSDLKPFEESTIELRETAEEPVIEKTARVVEEVVVGKHVSERTEQVSDTVRRTQVDIEPLAPADDAYFRGHWTSIYAGEGGTYENYAPAYAYGSSIADHADFRGRPWHDIEPALRTDWEARNPGSAWEAMKAAVRHGWERVTG
jgi:uncharacterized protein (TIGR02271 family)